MNVGSLFGQLFHLQGGALAFVSALAAMLATVITPRVYRRLKNRDAASLDGSETSRMGFGEWSLTISRYWMYHGQLKRLPAESPQAMTILRIVAGEHIGDPQPDLFSYQPSVTAIVPRAAQSRPSPPRRAAAG